MRDWYVCFEFECYEFNLKISVDTNERCAHIKENLYISSTNVSNFEFWFISFGFYVCTISPCVVSSQSSCMFKIYRGFFFFFYYFFLLCAEFLNFYFKCNSVTPMTMSRFIIFIWCDDCIIVARRLQTSTSLWSTENLLKRNWKQLRKNI